MKEIVNDDGESQKILEKAEYVKKSAQVNKQFVDNERLKYGENSNTCLITCSGNFNNIGFVTNTNNEITRILGFTKQDIFEQNVSKIMPKAIADLHDGFMRNYLETSVPKVIGTERLVLCQDKSGYLVPCTLMIKVLPNLDEGIQIVGFLKDIEQNQNMLKSQFEGDEKVHYMMYDQTKETILGVTYSCYQSLGIPASLVSGNSSGNSEFTIDQIMPEMNEQKNLEEMRQPQGYVTTIDTTFIQTNFLLDEENSEDESQNDDHEAEVAINASTNGNGNTAGNGGNQDDDGQKQSKFKKTKVRVHLISSDQWKEITINTIKFVEVDENEEGNVMKSTKMAETVAKNVHDELQNDQNLQDMEQEKQEGENQGADAGSQ